MAPIIALLASCVALSEDECRYMNWEARGVMDGVRGIPASKVNEYDDRCARYGVTVDEVAYETGRVQGVASYCTKSNGYAVAMKGRRYQFSCTASNESMFLSGYRPGRKLYLAWHHVREGRNSLYSSEITIKNGERRINTLLNELSNQQLTEQEKQEHRNDLDKTRESVQRAHEQIGYWKGRMPNLIAACENAVLETTEAGFVVEVSCY